MPINIQYLRLLYREVCCILAEFSPDLDLLGIERWVGPIVELGRIIPRLSLLTAALNRRADYIGSRRSEIIEPTLKLRNRSLSRSELG